MNKKIRILALILTVVMIIGVLPLAIFAKDGKPVSDLNNALDIDALEELAAKAENPLYQMPTTSQIEAALGIQNNESHTGSNGAFVSEGHYGTKEDGGTGFIPDHLHIAGSGGPNKQTQTYVYGEDHVEFRDVPSGGDVSINYTNGADFQDNTRYIYFSMNMMRGEAMSNGLAFARIRLRIAGTAKDTKETTFVYYNNGNLSFGKNQGTAVPFSTGVYTNIAFVYDIETSTITSYMNGVKVYEQSGLFTDTFGRIHDINWWAGNAARNGRVYSLKNIRTLFINDADTLAACVAEDTALASGVYKVGNDYYLYENNFPVLGQTREIDGYEIVTEENTGKIVKCMPTDYRSVYYERWNAADYTAAGVTLSKNYIGTGISGTLAADTKGYSCTEQTAEDGTVTYTISKDMVVILPKCSIGTVVDDGFELTAKNRVPSIPYYSALPADKVAILDEDGTTVIGYTSATAPDKNTSTIYKDLSYYTGLEDTSVGTKGFIDGSAVINFRFKAGEGTMNTNIFRFRYHINDTKKVQSKDIGKISMVDGVPHFVISGIDCGILRDDIYTDYSMKTYLKDNVLVYDLYVNGVLKQTEIVLQSSINNYMVSSVGTYAGTGAFWEKPLVTWGTVQVYYGEKVNDNPAPYTGNILADDGKVYTYENGMAIAVTADYTASGMVELTGYNATLSDNIGINFYAKIPANATKAVVTVGTEEKIINPAYLTPDENGACKITANVSAINMAEQIKLAFYDAEDNAIAIITEKGACDDYYSTSVKTYAETLIEGAEIDTDVEIAAAALLTYGAFAENYFGKNTEFTTSISPMLDEFIKTFDPSSVSGTISGSSAKLGTVNLILNNTTKIRVNLKEAAVVESDNANIIYVEEDGKYYIDICKIDAKNLDTAYTFTVDGTEAKISALGVAGYVANTDTFDLDFINLMKALYYYNLACEALV